jgi:hypothetical protein
MSIFKRVVFTKKDNELVKIIALIPNLSAFFTEETKSKMLRFVDYPVSLLQFSTSALPSDGPFFPRTPEVINLNVRDGGYF